jgi:hypothetical protein
MNQEYSKTNGLSIMSTRSHNKGSILFSIYVLLAFVLFFPWGKVDAPLSTLRYIMVLAVSGLHSFLYADEKLNKINRIVSVILIVIVSGLG